MKITETEAIVLKSFSLGDADKIVLFLTRENGLARITVRGAKRLKNRFGGSMELFTVAQIVYGQKEEAELGRLSSSETVKSFFYLAKDLPIQHALAYFVEILTQITPPHEPNEKLYRMVRASFDAMAELTNRQTELPLLTSYFEIWLLRLAGFFPDFRLCSNCRHSIKDRDVYFLASEARLICEQCVDFVAARRGELMNADLKKLLRAALVLPPLEFVNLAAQLRIENKSIETITRRLLHKLLEYQPSYWQNAALTSNAAESVSPSPTAL